MQDALINNDTLQTVQDTVSSAMENSDVFNKITFDLSLIGNSEGFLISIVSYAIVFLSLLFLYIMFANLAKLMQLNIRKKLKAEGRETTDDDLSIPGEISAAISMALHLHFEEAHDLENTILTIKKVQRPYSPWSSKIYGLREYPRKK